MATNITYNIPPIILLTAIDLETFIEELLNQDSLSLSIGCNAHKISHFMQTPNHGDCSVAVVSGHEVGSQEV